jgi:hypothetical protein
MFTRYRNIDCAFPSRDEEDEDEEPVFDKDGNPIGNRSPTPPRSAVTLSDLLNVLDSVSSEEGRLTFSTVRFASMKFLFSCWPVMKTNLSVYPVQARGFRADRTCL